MPGTAEVTINMTRWRSSTKCSTVGEHGFVHNEDDTTTKMETRGI